jgi:peptide/nickel transport system substrate-binding protein
MKLLRNSDRPFAHRYVLGWIKTLQWGAAMTAVGVVVVAGCQRGEPCRQCDTLVVAATGEPTTLVPPLVAETVGRDISDLVFERLAVLNHGGSPADTAAFRPGLAESWIRLDSLSLKFTIRRGAAWSDGTPVRAEDVAFSFAAAVDTALGAPVGVALEGVKVSADDQDHLTVTFPRPNPEQLYRAAALVRIIPKHIWDSIPRAKWAADSGLAPLVGSGPYRVTQWVRRQSLVLDRIRGGAFRQIVWRFAQDQETALNLVLSGEADVVETVTSPSARDRARQDTLVKLIPYPAAVYGFLGFRHADHNGVPHPILADRAVRRALTLAVNRDELVHGVIGPDAVVPPGPMSRALWIWDTATTSLGYDPAAAKAALDAAGWTMAPDGIRRRGSQRLNVEILVPSTSVARKNLAEVIQQSWKQIGVAAKLAAVDFPVFQERLGQGKFDAMIGAWIDEPSAGNLADQWTKRGFGALNYGRYYQPTFDSLYSKAMATPGPAEARLVWRQAIGLLNDDAAAVFLYTPTNIAVASKRLANISINPFSWLENVLSWTKGPG